MNPVYQSARFASSASDPRRCPDAEAEVAFAGRSNAGKSSAINALTGQRKLARTGRTPGRTQLINHFALTLGPADEPTNPTEDGRIAGPTGSFAKGGKASRGGADAAAEVEAVGGRYLVDLPGYGYAQVSKERQRDWQRSMTEYLVGRDCLRGLVVVMDIRHPLTEIDRRLIELQQAAGCELHVLLTKADKISRGETARTLEKVRRELEEVEIDATLQSFSALKRQGIDDVHAVLDHWLWGVPLP